MHIAFSSCFFFFFYPIISQQGWKEAWHVAVFGNGAVLIMEGANESARTAKDKAWE